MIESRPLEAQVGRGRNGEGRMRANHLPYQFSLLTCQPAPQVLDEVAARTFPGVSIVERTGNYLVVRPDGRRRYGPDIAVALGIAIVLCVLIATALSAVVVVLLPLALAPAIPLALDDRPALAVSAMATDQGIRVTAHGEASPDLAAELDAYLASLPPAHELSREVLHAASAS